MDINALVEDAQRSIEIEIQRGTLQVEDYALQQMLEIFRQTLESATPLSRNVQNSRPSSILTDTPESSADGRIISGTAGSTLFQASCETGAPPNEEQNTAISLHRQSSTVVPYNESSPSRHIEGDNGIIEAVNTACLSSSSAFPGVSNLSLSGSIGNSYPPSSEQATKNDFDLSGSNLWPSDPSQSGLGEQQDSVDALFDPDPSFFSQDPDCQMESLGISADSHSYSVEDVETYLTHHDAMVELLQNENEDPRATAPWEKRNDGNRFLQNW